MTQLLELDLVTADPDNSLPTDGPAGPGRVLIGDVASASVTLQNAVDNGSTAELGTADTTIALSGTSRTAEVLTVEQVSATSGTPIATLSGDHSAAHVAVTGPSAEGSLKLYGNQVLSSDARLDIGADSVGTIGIEAGTLRVPVGSAALPGIANDTTPGTGIQIQSAAIGLSTTGTSRLTVNSFGLDPTTDGGARLGFASARFSAAHASQFVGDGTHNPVAPTFSPGSEGTGMSLVSPGVLGFTALEGTRVHITTTAIIPATDGGAKSGNSVSRWSESWTQKDVVKSSGTTEGSEEIRETGTLQTSGLATKSFAISTAQDRAYWVEATVIASDSSDAAVNAMYRIMVRAHNKGGVLAVQTPIDVITPSEDAGLTSASVSASASVQDIHIDMTGVDATDINWAVTVRYQAVAV